MIFKIRKIWVILFYSFHIVAQNGNSKLQYVDPTIGSSNYSAMEYITRGFKD